MRQGGLLLPRWHNTPIPCRLPIRTLCETHLHSAVGDMSMSAATPSLRSKRGC
jgi:hypothetical protein